MAELIITLSDGRVNRHVLTLKPQEIGRDLLCGIPIDDPTVSRHHADIRGDSTGRFVLRDLGSKNGTYVKQIPITTYELNPGDEIMFGSVVARFQNDETSESHSSITLDEQTTRTPEAVSFAKSSDRLQLSHQRLQMLYEVSDRLTTLRDRRDLLEDIMKICIETFEFERAAIALKRPDGRTLDWPVIHNLRAPDGEIRISRTILHQALDEGQRAVFSDATIPKPCDPSMSIVVHGTRSAMCVPIVYSDRILGVIYGDRISTGRPYDQEDVDFLAALARQLSIGLTNAMLLEQQQQKNFLERDIGIARQIQSDLLPRSLDVHPALTIAAINDPGRQVSGDYYDVMVLRDGRIGVVIADVTGKGVSAALLTANLQAAVRLLFPECLALDQMAAQLNRLVFQNTDAGRFITALLAIFDPIQRQTLFVSAGHPNPICISSSGARTLSPYGELPFGVMQNSEYTVQHISWQDPNTTFLFYTDGLNEAINEREEQYGLDRLLRQLNLQTDADPRSLLDHLRTDVSDFAGNTPAIDDLTMVAVRCT